MLIQALRRILNGLLNCFQAMGKVGMVCSWCGSLVIPGLLSACDTVRKSDRPELELRGTERQSQKGKRQTLRKFTVQTPLGMSDASNAWPLSSAISKSQDPARSSRSFYMNRVKQPAFQARIEEREESMSVAVRHMHALLGGEVTLGHSVLDICNMSLLSIMVLLNHIQSSIYSCNYIQL